MAWTPPSKFTVIISFLICAFGIFILYDLAFFYPEFEGILYEWDFKIGDFNVYETWMLIAMVVLFLAWFLMFLGVRLKGL
ncbi:MAG: hypothetical protein ACFE9T_10260 [Promethearchaeota archaeon]